ncbi:MAG: DUF456 domain-containing protein [Phycisphaeraceae bacterium]
MIFVWASLVTLLNAVWLFTVAIGLPGTWLMILTAAAVNWYTAPEQPLMPWSVLMLAVVLATLGEIAEFALGAVGSSRSGGTRWGAVGAIIGAIVGGIVGTFAIPVPLIGSIVGACAGAFAGTLLVERGQGRTWGASMQSGHGAAMGRLWGTVAKLGIGCVIWFMLALAAFWPTAPTTVPAT